MDVFRRPMKLNLPPLQAIREKCVQDCANGYTEAVDDCLIPYCSLYPYRFGSVPEDKKGVSLLQVVHKKCIECSCGEEKRVESCNIKDCPV